MDINEKIDIIKESCERLLKNDTSELNKLIDAEIEKRIEDEVREYQEKEEFSYNKKMEKMEKDYNKQRYSLEMEFKKEILNQKSLIQKELKKCIIQLMEKFTESIDYENFLMTKINDVIQKNPNTENSILGIVRKDNEKFANKIIQKYQINLKIIDDKYIGGCILEDRIQGIYIDNTIRNGIDENL